MQNNLPQQTEQKVLLEQIKNGHIITLNREKQLNALDHDVTSALRTYIQEAINKKQENNYFIFQGKGRAFCAGGDIKSQYNTYKENKHDMVKYMDVLDKCNVDEYGLYYTVSTLKNQIAYMNGIIMGGGSGLAIYCNHRIATEKTMYAMPEAKIGFFTDVACSYFYSRVRKNIGTYLGITGTRLNGIEMVNLGLADYYILSDQLEQAKQEIINYLNSCEENQVSDEKIKEIFQKYNSYNDNKIEKIQNEDRIVKYFENVQTYNELVSNLKQNQDTDQFAKETLQNLQTQCPLSLRVIFDLIKRGRNYNVKQAFQIDFRIAHWFNQEGEFFEGTRCVLVDKNDTPKFKYQDAEKIDQKLIDGMFENIFENEKLYNI